MSVDQEMSPEEEAAAHADFIQAFDEMIPSSRIGTVRIELSDGGELEMAKARDEQRILLETPPEDSLRGVTRYHVSEAGELVDLETRKPAPGKAVEFAKEIRNPRLI